MAQVVIGMQTLLYVPNYSCYSDQATLPIVLGVFLTCVCVHRLSIMCGKCCKIWKIDEIIEKVTENADMGDEFVYLYNRINRM